MALATLYAIFFMALVYRMMVGKPDNKKITQVKLEKKSKKVEKEE